jgi:TolB protein
MREGRSMVRINGKIESALMLLAATMLLVGCGVQYNGAFSFYDADREQIEAYRETLRDRDLTLGSEQTLATPQPQPSVMTPMPRTMPQTNLASVDRQPQPVSQTPSARPAASPDVYGSMVPMTASTTSGPSRDGSTAYQRVTFANEGADFDPDIDPTGKFLIFASTRHRQTADLYYKKTDASAVTQLTNDPANDVMPAVSPDGRQVAFASDRQGNWDIYVMDTTGGQAMQLTNDPAHEIHPSFSPDGKWLVYCRYGDLSGQWELVVVELANPSTKRFIGYGLFPNWSPVDNRIVFQKARERGTRWFSIWTVELENGEAMRPTEIAASANAAVITPDWSPDGKFIVFCTVVDDGRGGMPLAGNNSSGSPRQADIWMVDVAGHNRINLTQSQFSNLQPVWAPGGTIYFTSNRSLAKGENVWSLRPDRALQVARHAAEPADKAMAEVPVE